MAELQTPDDPLLSSLRWVIRLCVRALAVLMTAVIVIGVADVAWELYSRLTAEPFMIMRMSDLLATFGAFMAVLIAIEIYVNIVLYLRDDVIHVKLVVATALMAIARKVIILDFETTDALEAVALAGVILATSIAYYIVNRYTTGAEVIGREEVGGVE
jgi:uncharacterized membrane protein (DUF373 family)